MLQLAIESYQQGRRIIAQQLFAALICRPEVGAPARFMSRLLAPVAPVAQVAQAGTAPLPGERAARTRRLVDETEAELEEEPDLWAQGESLAGADLANPKLLPFDFRNQPKCNIFVGEMLYRAGFVPPGTPPPGRLRVRYPSVNEMVAAAQRLARGETWDPGDGQQWFDVVDRHAAQPGDLVLIAGKDRGDHRKTEHGHVEIIRDIVYQNGDVKSLSTVGARSRGATLSPSAGRIFGVASADRYQFSELAVLVRPRMR
jgi:hypothetical protein